MIQCKGDIIGIFKIKLKFGSLKGEIDYAVS